MTEAKKQRDPKDLFHTNYNWTIKFEIMPLKEGSKCKKVIQFILCITILLSCGQPKTPYTEEIPKEERNDLSLSFRRFDLDLYRNSFKDATGFTDSLRNSYGQFFCDFVEADIRIGGCNDSVTAFELERFRNHPDILFTHEEIERVFPQEKMSIIEEAITEMMQRKNHFFPSTKTPEFIFYQAAWNNRIHVTDSIIAIALDYYLGRESKAISFLSPDLFPQYKKRDMTPEMIMPDLAKSIASYVCNPFYNEQGTLLDEIIIFGKMLSISKALLPETEDSLLLSYTQEQFEWAEANEWNTWKILADNRTIYSKQRRDIDRWFIEGPFTGVPGIPQNSAPQLGAFIGWKMVRQYAEKHPEISLQDVIALNDSKLFLETYTPQKK